ncbi:MAG: LytTR family DNA-binding domain-containing protein [Lutimonas sp.]
MKIKCIIIDDEPLAAEVIENYLKEFSNVEHVGSFTNPLEALELIESGEIEAVFIDINMPKMNGLEFIRSIESKPSFVITTAYREYAVESYDLDVLDYLVKPIPFNRFLKSINKLSLKSNADRSPENTLESSEKSFIFLKVDKKLVRIKYDDIHFIESLKDYIKVFTSEGDFLAHKSLTSITEELPKSKFLRIHRSFTVSLDKIEALEGNSVLLKGKRIPIGRKYVNHAKDVILNA